MPNSILIEAPSSEYVKNYLLSYDDYMISIYLKRPFIVDFPAQFFFLRGLVLEEILYMMCPFISLLLPANCIIFT